MGPNFGLSALDCHPPQVKGQLKALAHYREQLVQIEERHRQRLKGPPSLRSAKTRKRALSSRVGDAGVYGLVHA